MTEIKKLLTTTTIAYNINTQTLLNMIKDVDRTIKWANMTFSELERAIQDIAPNKLNELPWQVISCNGFLTEEFIERYWELLDKSGISEHQIMNKHFILKHIDELEARLLVVNPLISKEVKDELELWVLARLEDGPASAIQR